MPVEWTGTGPELLIHLDRTSAEPLSSQLQRELRSAIQRGRLAVGERLPSSRTLAALLGVSRGLVVTSFEQLQSEGYLTALAGDGTRVATAVGAELTAPTPDVQSAPVDVDFEYGIPDLAAFPTRDWTWAVTEAAKTAPIVLFGDEEGGGAARLRDVVAAYHRRVRASTASPANTLIVGGFRHGLNLVFAALARHGIGTVGLENPGPREHDVIAGRHGLAPVPIAVDDAGIDVADLCRSDARAVLVTPAHQCPMGVALSAERRHALVRWAHDVDGFIIEDDYDAEFRYDHQPLGSLQGLAPDRVIALGSVSKTLAPGMRIGWVVAPAPLVPAITDEKLLGSRGVPALDQLALALLIESGRFDRFLRRMRVVYRRRRDTLVAALDGHVGADQIAGLAAGCHLVLRLPPGVDEADVVARAALRSVRVYGVNRYRFDGTTGAPALVLGFGNLTESQVRRGTAVLVDVVGRAS